MKKTYTAVVGQIGFLVRFSPNLFIISLPIIADAFNTPLKHVQFTIPLYFLGAVISFLVSGPLSDMIGPYKTIKLLLPLFIIGAVICGSLQTLFSLYVGTFIMGFGIASTISLGKVLIKKLAETKQALATTVATINIIGLWAPSLAMVIGGHTALYFGWHTVFIINAALGLFTFVVILFVPIDVKEEKQRVTFATTMKETFGNYSKLIVSPYFLMPTIVNALLIGALYLHNTAGFYFYHKVLHLSIHLISFSIVFITAGAFLGNFILIRTSKFLSYKSQVMLGISITALASALFVVLAFIKPLGYWDIVVSVGLFMMGAGMLTPVNKIAIMDHFPNAVATGVNFSSVMQMAACSVLSFIGAHLHFHTAIPLSLAYAGVTVVCLLLIFGFRKAFS